MRAARRVLGIALFVVLLVGGWLFAARNHAPVQLDYFLGQTGELPLWVVLLAAFAAGGVLVGGMAAVEIARQAMLARRWRKAVAKLEREIHELRNLPLAPEPAAGEREARAAPLAHAPLRGS